MLPTGGFHFLFNICYPKNHPINAGGVPDEFTPLSRPIDLSFVATSRELSAYSVTSYSVSKVIGAELEFQVKSTGDEGAILALPNGLISEDLIATQGFSDYISEHLISWYRYIMKDRQCPIGNGDMRLVTGFEKTNAWGVATFSYSSKDMQLKLKPCNDLRRPQIYSWDHSGSCDTRAGTSRDGIGDHSMQINLNPASRVDSNMVNNQCVFVRTLNASFSSKKWTELKKKLFVEKSPDTDSYSETSWWGSVKSSNSKSVRPYRRHQSKGGNSFQGQPGRSASARAAIFSNASTSLVRAMSPPKLRGTESCLFRCHIRRRPSTS